MLHILIFNFVEDSHSTLMSGRATSANELTSPGAPLGAGLGAIRLSWAGGSLSQCSKGKAKALVGLERCHPGG